MLPLEVPHLEMALKVFEVHFQYKIFEPDYDDANGSLSTCSNRLQSDVDAVADGDYVVDCAIFDCGSVDGTVVIVDNYWTY